MTTAGSRIVNYLLIIITHIYVCVSVYLCMCSPFICLGMYLPWCACRVQRITFRRSFCLLTMDSGDQTQLLKLVEQALLSSEPFQWFYSGLNLIKIKSL